MKQGDETMTEKEMLDMAKAKTMIGNALFKEMQDNLSKAQMLLYISCMVEAEHNVAVSLNPLKIIRIKSLVRRQKILSRTV